MTRAEEYRVEFNKLEKLLKKRANARSEDFIKSVVSDLARKDRVILQFKRDIDQFIELRNAIIHQSTQKAIAEPYQETVDELRNLISSIEKPKTAWDIATKELVTISPTDTLSSVIRTMNEKQVTSLPIIEDGKILGFVSEATIVKIVDTAFEDSGVLIEEARIKDIKFDPPYGGGFDLYGYAPKKLTVYEVEDMFNDAIKDNSRLLAVIVTETGSNSSQPMGIITAWDLHRIDK